MHACAYVCVRACVRVRVCVCVCVCVEDLLVIIWLVARTSIVRVKGDCGKGQERIIRP